MGDPAEDLIGAIARRRGSGERVAAAAAAGAAVARMQGWGVTRALVPVDPWLEALGLEAAVREAGIEVLRFPAGRGWRELLGLEGPTETCGVTLPSAGVSERGTLVLEAGPGHGRAIDVVAARHLAVLPASKVVRSLDEALATSFRRGGRPPSAVSLVSAPSRTSDIEKISTLGAHGAVSLHLLVVDGA